MKKKNKKIIIATILVLILLTSFFSIRELLRKSLVSNTNIDELISISINGNEIENNIDKEELFNILKKVYAKKHWISQPCMCFKVEDTIYYITIKYSDGIEDEIYVTDLGFVARPIYSTNGHRPPLIMSYLGYNKVKNFIEIKQE